MSNKANNLHIKLVQSGFIIRTDGAPNPRKINENYYIRNHPELYKEINDTFPNNTWLEKMYLILHNLDEMPVCLGCGNSFERSGINDKRVYCSHKCNGKHKSTKEKRRLTNIEQYGVENPMHNESVKEVQRKTIQENWGVDNVFQHQEIQEKSRKTNIDKYGVPVASMSEEVKIKISNTNIQKYGTRCSLQNPIVQEKSRQTLIEKFGVDNYAKTNEFARRISESYNSKTSEEREAIKEKRMQTNIKHFGEDNFSKTELFKEIVKDFWENISEEDLESIRSSRMQTCMERYDVEHYSQTDKFREDSSNRQQNMTKEEWDDIIQKRIQTNIENWGVKHHFQVEEIFKSSMKSNKTYTFPSGNEVYVQGYEPFAIDMLLETYEENDIVVQPTGLGIKYEFDGKISRYYPDILIKSENLIVEVKSEYTMNSHYDRNLKKKEVCESLGYNFVFLIFDGKGNLI